MYLGVVVAVVLAPLAYEGWNSSVAAAAAVRIPLLLGLSGTAMIFTATVRSKRLALHQEAHEASRLARADSLTALGNRRAFDEVLERATTGSRSSDRPLSVLLADLEGFKAINDRHGHLEGDRCLREVASALRTAVRTPDNCFRWGGDEFALVLTATDGGGARAVGGACAELVAGHGQLPGGDPLGLGWGVAELSDGLDAADLVAAADRALLAAKAGCEERTATESSRDQHSQIAAVPAVTHVRRRRTTAVSDARRPPRAWVAQRDEARRPRGCSSRSATTTAATGRRTTPSWRRSSA